MARILLRKTQSYLFDSQNFFILPIVFKEKFSVLELITKAVKTETTIIHRDTLDNTLQKSFTILKIFIFELTCDVIDLKFN